MCAQRQLKAVKPNSDINWIDRDWSVPRQGKAGQCLDFNHGPARFFTQRIHVDADTAHEHTCPSSRPAEPSPIPGNYRVNTSPHTGRCQLCSFQCLFC